MKKEMTTKLLMNAAKKIIHSEGHQFVTVRHVAEEAGYTYPILYHYFKDLDSLLWNLRLEMIEDMISELPKPSLKNIDPVSDLKRVLKTYAEYYFYHPNVFRFFYFYPFKKPENDDGYDKLEQRFQGMWQQSFVRLVQEGYMKQEEIATVAKTIIYTIQGMILLSLSANGSLTEKEVYKELDLIIDYIIRKEA